jgi:Cu/Ag efflux protein CusF
MNLLALQPAIRPGVESVEVSARTPDGATQVLLFAKGISLDWPTSYVYRRPVSLPKGTELSVIEHYAGETSVPVAAVPVTFSVYQGSALATDQPKAQRASASTRRFELSGTVKSVDAAGGHLVVDHGDIPGFMGAMTMSYKVGQHENLKNISAADQIRSDVVVSETGSYLENIEVTRRGK